MVVLTFASCVKIRTLHFLGVETAQRAHLVVFGFDNIFFLFLLFARGNGMGMGYAFEWRFPALA